MRKNAEINCLPQRCIWKKFVCRDHLCNARFGEFKKNCLYSRSEGKPLASIQSMVKKNFLPSRNHDTPGGRANTRPSLKIKVSICRWTLQLLFNCHRSLRSYVLEQAALMQGKEYLQKPGVSCLNCFIKYT